MPRKKNNESLPRRRLVTVNLGIIDKGTSFEQLCQMVESARNRPEVFISIEIDFETTRGYYDDIETEVRLVGRREETDEEMNLRLAEEQRQRERQMSAKEREFYRLAKELGKQVG